MTSFRDFQARVATRLKQTPTRLLNLPHRGTAAVLIGIVEEGKEPCFLLTKRTNNVGTHKGQISFPGGLRETGDKSLEVTALRECNEEIGLDPKVVSLVGRFHDYLAITDWLVVPYVGFLPRRLKLAPNPHEVEKLLRIPVRFFRETSPRIEQRERFGRQVPVYFYEFEGETVWGLTAAMIKDFVEVIFPAE